MRVTRSELKALIRSRKLGPQRIAQILKAYDRGGIIDDSQPAPPADQTSPRVAGTEMTGGAPPPQPWWTR